MTLQPETMEEYGEMEEWMVEIERDIERSLWKWDLTMDPDAPVWIPPPNILIHQLSRYTTPEERTTFYVHY